MECCEEWRVGKGVTKELCLQFMAECGIELDNRIDDEDRSNQSELKRGKPQYSSYCWEYAKVRLSSGFGYGLLPEHTPNPVGSSIWVVVKTMVPFWVP